MSNKQPACVCIVFLIGGIGLSAKGQKGLTLIGMTSNFQPREVVIQVCLVENRTGPELVQLCKCQGITMDCLSILSFLFA